MKKIFFFITLFLSFSIISSKAGEINFDVSESKILEEGNLIKGYGGGKAITDDNIIIIADTFVYNKKTTILEATGDVEVIDQNKDITINANKIFYIKNIDKFYTVGKTKSKVSNDYLIESSDVNYFRTLDLMTSEKKAHITDAIKNIYTVENYKFEIIDRILKGKNLTHADLIGDNYSLTEGIINFNTNELIGKDLLVAFNKNKYENPIQDPRLKGNVAYSNQQDTKISKGVYTTCKFNGDKCPPWMMQATTIEHDKEKKQIKYKNAWLKVYDVPVVYFPVFFHPDPTVSRQSGFLKPVWSSSDTLGRSLYAPYFQIISEDKDLTIKPKFFVEDKVFAVFEFRDLNKNSSTFADFGTLFGHKSSIHEKEKDTRSFIFAKHDVSLDWKRFLSSTLVLNVEKTNNDTLLKVFKPDSALLGDSEFGSTHSYINLDLEHEKYDFKNTFDIYEALGGHNSDRYQYVLPNYSFTKLLDFREDKGSSFTLNHGAYHSISNTNVKDTSMTNSLTYASETFYTDLGLTSDFQIFLNNENSHGQNSTTFRHKPFHELVTSYMYNINLPLVNSGENFSNYLTPKIALKFSPHKTKDISNDLRRLSVDNLFSFDRIGYANNVEEGGSLTAGLNYYLENDNFDRLLNFEIGASWKDVRNSHLPKNSTLGLKTSDIVGRIEYDPPSFNKTDTTFEFDYDFLLDNDVTTLNYNQFTTRISINQLVTEFKFVKEDNYVGAASYWSNKARFQFDDNNSLIIPQEEIGSVH